MYVGKARSLKKRVSNYAQGRLHSNRLTRMVRETVHMEFVTTGPRSRRFCWKRILSSACGRVSTCCCATTRAFPIS